MQAYNSGQSYSNSPSSDPRKEFVKGHSDMTSKYNDSEFKQMFHNLPGPNQNSFEEEKRDVQSYAWEISANSFSDSNFQIPSKRSDISLASDRVR